MLSKKLTPQQNMSKPSIRIKEIANKRADAFEAENPASNSAERYQDGTAWVSPDDILQYLDETHAEEQIIGGSSVDFNGDEYVNIQYKHKTNTVLKKNKDGTYDVIS